MLFYLPLQMLSKNKGFSNNNIITITKYEVFWYIRNCNLNGFKMHISVLFFTNFPREALTPHP